MVTFEMMRSLRLEKMLSPIAVTGSLQIVSGITRLLPEPLKDSILPLLNLKELL
jgi:hypothetical protein